MNSIEKVNEFLTQAVTFYLTTVDGNRPKCRPIGFHMVNGDKLYFGVGEFKEVYKQMQINPNVEVCAAAGKEFLRYYGKAVFETDYSIAEKGQQYLSAMSGEWDRLLLAIREIKGE